MKVKINKSKSLKKKRKFEVSIYPENEHDIKTLLEMQTSIALANAKKHGKIGEDKPEYLVTFNFND